MQKKTIPPFKVTSEVYERLAEESGKRGLTMSALYREILTNHALNDQSSKLVQIDIEIVKRYMKSCGFMLVDANSLSYQQLIAISKITSTCENKG